MSNNKKFNRLEQERQETMRQIPRLENEIQAIEKERAELIAEDVMGKADGKEVQQSRRMRGCLERLSRTEQDLKNARTKLQVILEKQAEEVISLRQRAAEVLNHSRGELVNQEDQCRIRQEKLWKEYNDTIAERSKYHGLAEKKKSIIKNFSRLSDSDILQLMQEPINPKFRGINSEIILALGITEPWQKGKDKYREQENAEIARAKAEREKELQYLRGFKIQAEKMISGSIPWPSWLSTHRRLSITATDLAYFLRLRSEKEQAKNSEVN